MKTTVKCNCGKELSIVDKQYEDWGNTQIILVEEHKCLQYSSEYNAWCEEYYAYEGDVDDKN